MNGWADQLEREHPRVFLMFVALFLLALLSYGTLVVLVVS